MRRETQEPHDTVQESSLRISCTLLRQRGGSPAQCCSVAEAHEGASRSGHLDRHIQDRYRDFTITLFAIIHLETVGHEERH